MENIFLIFSTIKVEREKMNNAQDLHKMIKQQEHMKREYILSAAQNILL